ncbi:MAG: nucleotidyltransferase family protein [Acidobacteria bacterium]|nr:nucleotidyltransferase family protein [Acidobacteriota bacterium]
MIPLEEFAEVLWRPAHLDWLVSRYGADEVLWRARQEGLAPYLAWRLPASTLLADARRTAVLDDAVRRPAIVAACDALGAAGLRPLVFKGGAWAHTTYPEPWCRPSMDLDLLVRRDERAPACVALQAAGFTPSGRIPGDYVNHQEAFTRSLAPGITFTVDLHWQISNRPMVAAALPETALLARAFPAPYAGAHAWQADAIDSLLIACLHPVAHHPDHVRLMWWLDVARLAETLPADRLEAVRARAAHAGVSGLVAHALGEARRWCYGTDPAAPALSAAFRQALASAGTSDASLALLNPARGLLADVWTDLRALPTTRARLVLAREHLLPPAAFMYTRYGTRRPWMLPVLYARRLVAGGVRWLRDWITGRRPAT